MYIYRKKKKEYNEGFLKKSPTTQAGNGSKRASDFNRLFSQ